MHRDSFEITPAGRLRSLQAVRGIAAGLVVVAHSIEHAARSKINPVLLTGRFGVELFFVLSGFVIVHSVGQQAFDPLRFLARRVWRVGPLYWVLTALVAGTAMITPAVFKTTKLSAHYLLGSVLFFPVALPGTYDWRPLFKLGWTLDYEMFFYLVVACLFWCRSSTTRVAYLTTTLCILSAGHFLITPGSSPVTFYLNLDLVPFAVGAWLMLLWQTGLIFRASPEARMALFAGALVALAIFYRVPFPQTKFFIGHMTMTIAATFVVASLLTTEEYWAKLGFVQWLGSISYSLYLTHMFVVGAGWALLSAIHVRLASPAGIAGAAAIVVAALLVGGLSYRYIELPLLALGRERRPLRQSVS